MPFWKQSTMYYEPQLNYAVTKVSETDRDHVFELDKQTGAPTPVTKQQQHAECVRSASVDYGVRLRRLRTEGGVHHTQYTPYGFSHLPSTSTGGPSVGFNGLLRDPITGRYHLGNGYRVYNPVLMRFHHPDPWSPFTSLGDPINRVDSSGHFGILGWKFSWKDLLVTVVGITASVAVGALNGGASLAIQLGVSVAVGVVADFATSTIYDVAAGNKISWVEVGIDLAFSALSGLTFGVGDATAQAIRKPAQAVAKAATKKTATKVFQGLAKDIGKKMVVTGTTTAVDKAVMDPIKDALAGEIQTNNTSVP
ncbi:hypothetical protein BO82DRAFT_369584 [Aspergillus uvarum CBS 121591]|uniref:RHS repeat-associated core domain-containing protein n=1 Tax=Aspergillus uvarum CBS 121591 TaxID=1448315 RepID=A0A319BUA5_9EURO|nr:hypothetical protein BO82DRAFT_369584 [Aspergillus uvarum CBS 121591]PYH76174.1 hypothetical protein BO82DRAFT_369584 [Aspergillus uvarum CBS 121591]